jgi:hypothetical protein
VDEDGPDHEAGSLGAPLRLAATILRRRWRGTRTRRLCEADTLGRPWLREGWLMEARVVLQARVTARRRHVRWYMPIHDLGNLQPDPISQHRAVVVDDFFQIKEQSGASDKHLFRLRDVDDEVRDAPRCDYKPPEICFSDRGSQTLEVGAGFAQNLPCRGKAPGVRK